MSATNERTVTLRHGAVMPRIGLGTSPMGEAETEAIIPLAIEAGVRLIDTAENYRNESAIGRGIKASGIARDELFVTTKFNKNWHGRELVGEAFEKSAERLGLDYVDLLLIHWPNPAHDRYVEAYEGMLELLASGVVRAIGCSNFKAAHLERIVAATGDAPDVNQVQLNPSVTRAELRTFDATQGIVTQSWSPLGGDGARVLEEPVIAEIAAAHERTPAQVVLRWHLELGLSAVPKSGSAARVRSNLALFDFALSPTEVAAISALDRGEQAAVDSDAFGH